MATKNPQNPIGHVIFTDGIITRIHRDGSTTMMEFDDYTGATIKIIFSAVSELIQSKEALTYDVMDVRFHSDESRWRATFLDDDGETLLEISYVDARGLGPKG